MIGRLSGTIAHRETDGSVIVDVNGVGYEVFLPLGTAGRLGSEPGQSVVLQIHTHVREDAMTLYGFATTEDRAAFRALLKVNSIGPKLALAIIGVMNAGELQDAVARQDKTAFKGISGVGKRTVERLRAVPSPADSSGDTVVGALVQMGYKRSEAEAAVGAAMGASSDENIEGLLRAALSALS